MITSGIPTHSDICRTTKNCNFLIVPLPPNFPARQIVGRKRNKIQGSAGSGDKNQARHGARCCSIVKSVHERDHVHLGGTQESSSWIHNKVNRSCTRHDGQQSAHNWWSRGNETFAVLTVPKLCVLTVNFKTKSKESTICLSVMCNPQKN